MEFTLLALFSAQSWTTDNLAGGPNLLSPPASGEDEASVPLA